LEELCRRRLALNERQTRDVPTVEVQEVEGVIDEPHSALAVARSLGMGEARQSGVVNAAEFAVEIGGLRL
jgi:hypothetical protein